MDTAARRGERMDLDGGASGDARDRSGGIGARLRAVAGAVLTGAAMVRAAGGGFARRRPVAAIAALLLALLLGAGGAWAALTTTGPEPRDVTLSQVLAEVRAGHARSARLTTGDEVELRLASGERVRAGYPSAYAGDLTATLLNAGVTTRAEAAGDTSAGAALIARLLPILLLGALLVGMLRLQTGGGGRRSRATPVDVPQTRFDAVAGCDEAIGDLSEIAALLTTPERFTATGARIPRGYLLVGPPGTGKTLLARAVAGEAGVPFFSTSGADFNDMYVGVGRKRIRALFAQARKAATRGGGAVVFLDEIDAVGAARAGGRRDSATDDRDATLISLLTELDGFTERGNIVVLAATNRPEALDAALTRPGRFDRQIAVPAPDSAGRAAILRVHARALELSDDVDLDSLGRRTPGLVGADLENLLNEAALEAGRRGERIVDASCVEEALATVAMGRARTSALVTERDRRITAWHEGGHTVLALVEEHADDPVSVTIVPRGVSGGTTWMGGNDHAFLTREQAYARLAVALGGRAGEELALGGSFSQGAAGDLDSATRLAVAMATEYGMTRLGLARRPVTGSELPSDVLEVVNELLEEALATARVQLERHADLLDAVVAGLLDRETLPAAELRALKEQFLGAAGAPEGGVGEAAARIPRARTVSAHAATNSDETAL